MGQVIARYGAIPRDRVDVRGQQVLSVDLRAETGAFGTPNASRVIAPPHPFTLSVFGVAAGESPVAEVLIWWQGKQVVLVGHLTGRPGVAEITPDHLMLGVGDDAYAQRLRDFLLAAG